MRSRRACTDIEHCKAIFLVVNPVAFLYNRPMSGHSKWAQIKRQKGVQDIKRGQAFTKLGNAITVAVKTGAGGDASTNIRLRLAVDQARAANMPKENIQRAIDRGLGKSGNDRPIDEVTYEGYAPFGVGLIIQGVTDNKQRTVASIKNVLERSGGSLATPGSVSWQFQKRILLTISPRQPLDKEMLMLIDAGVEDVETVGDTILAYVLPEKLEEVKRSIGERTIDSEEMTLSPTTQVPIQDEEKARKILSIVERLEEMDDVLKVYGNFDIPEDVLTRVVSA